MVNKKKLTRQELELIARQRWEKADIRDNFIYIKVFSNTRLSQPIMELAYGRSFGHIENTDYEKVIVIDGQARSVRLDLVFQGKNFICNCEMQKGAFPNKEKRIRYYHVMLDFSSIEKGDNFIFMKDKVVIVFCDRDPFGEGLPIYRLETKCSQLPFLNIDDGVTTIFLNSKAYKKLEPGLLRDFLAYIEGEEPQHEIVRAIDRHVRLIKKDKTLEDEFMSISLSALLDQYDARDEGIVIGRDEGIEIGRDEGIVIGRDEGIEIGEHKRSREIAQNLIRTFSDLSDSAIAGIAELSLKEVQRIRRQM